MRLAYRCNLCGRLPGWLQPARKSEEEFLANITMKEFLEAGVHFGHQTRRWNPKMKEYIYGERNGIYIIDLQKTLKLFKEAAKFLTDLGARGQDGAVCGHEASGAGGHCRGSRPLRHVLREPSLAGRLADQSFHDSEVHSAPQRTGRDEPGWALRAADQERSSAAGA